MALPDKEAQALKEALNEVKKAQEGVELALLKEKLVRISELLRVVQV